MTPASKLIGKLFVVDTEFVAVRVTHAGFVGRTIKRGTALVVIGVDDDQRFTEPHLVFVASDGSVCQSWYSSVVYHTHEVT